MGSKVVSNIFLLFSLAVDLCGWCCARKTSSLAHLKIGKYFLEVSEGDLIELLGEVTADLPGSPVIFLKARRRNAIGLVLPDWVRRLAAGDNMLNGVAFSFDKLYAAEEGKFVGFFLRFQSFMAAILLSLQL